MLSLLVKPLLYQWRAIDAALRQVAQYAQAKLELVENAVLELYLVHVLQRVYVALFVPVSFSQYLENFDLFPRQLFGPHCQPPTLPCW